MASAVLTLLQVARDSEENAQLRSLLDEAKRVSWSQQIGNDACQTIIAANTKIPSLKGEVTDHNQAARLAEKRLAEVSAELEHTKASPPGMRRAS